MVSTNIRRPLQPHELEPLRLLGAEVKELRRRSGLSCRQLSAVVLFTTRHVERIEQGARRTRRSTLERLVDALVLAAPDLGQRDELVARLVRAAGPALAPESPYAGKSQARREGKAQRIADRRAMYAHLPD